VAEQQERNKAVVRRLFDEVWNGRNYDNIDELYASDYLFDYRPYREPVGRDSIREAVERAYASFPDYHEELLALVAEDDTVVVHMRITGTQDGQWGPVPPTGKPVDYEEIAILEFRDGQVIHQRGIVDNLAALRQLGVIPAP
jgi:predicted ester cyclase